jgi:hypothetical protein
MMEIGRKAPHAGNTPRMAISSCAAVGPRPVLGNVSRVRRIRNNHFRENIPIRIKIMHMIHSRTAHLLFTSVCLAALLNLATGCQPHKNIPDVADSSNSLPANTVPAGSRIFHMEVGGGAIELAVTPGQLNVSDAAIQNWVRTAATAISGYFGHYPIRRVRIMIVAAQVGPIGDGMTTDEQIRVTVGPEATEADLDSDWIMTHEMFHLAFPDMDDQYIWLREGLASYLEPLARARIGNLPVKKVWRDIYEGLPRGQPQSGDQGLDNTHTQGRTYWGGSMFCLLADLRIREQTHNRRSLDDAMRVILEHGGNRFSHWTMQQVMDVGDQATGTTVLHDLYMEMGNSPATIDLDALWRRLGVQYQDRRILFDNTAPLAQIRISMTDAGANPKPTP